MNTLNRHIRLPQHGMTLVEIMVGMTIGLIAVLIMSQMAITYDRQKRSTAGSADAQNTGAIALYSLESDLMQAGYGTTSLHTLNCTIQSAVESPTMNGRRLIPTLIIPDGMARTDTDNVLGIPPGDAGSDILVVMYGDTVYSAEGVPISASTATTYSFSRNVTGFNTNDLVLAAQNGQPCTIGRVTTIANPTITVNQTSTATYAANTARVFNIGSGGLTVRVYAVRNGNLTVCDFWNQDCAQDISALSAAQLAALWVPIASNTVAIRAQYGWDTSATADMRVETYCRSRLSTTTTNCPVPDDGLTAPATVPNTACDWTRMASLRVALITRSAEKAPGNTTVSPATIQTWPTVAAGTISGTATIPATQAPVFTVPDRQYRYKVFSTITPIRNAIWHGSEASCI